MKKIKPKYVCVFILLFFFLVNITIIFITHGKVLDRLFFSDHTDSFMDFFNSINHSFHANPYQIGTIYPPLSYVIYHFIGMFVPTNIVLSSGHLFRESLEGQAILMVYNIVIILLFISTLKYCLNCEKRLKLLITLLLAFSFPFLYAFQRGNMIILAIITLMFFVFNYDNKNKIIRELALISLAISASLKIYPALFGLLLLKEKKWGQGVRCVIYGIAIFILPFVFFDGISGMKMYINNLLNTSGMMNAYGYACKISFANTISAFLKLNHITISVGKILPYVYCISAISIVSFFTLKERWKRLLLLSLIIMGVPEFSFTYNSLYLLIPLIDYLNNVNDKKISTFIYGILMSLGFVAYLFIRNKYFIDLQNGTFLYTATTYSLGVVYLLLFILINVEGITKLIDIIKNRIGQNK